MVFAIPTLQPNDVAVLGLIQSLRQFMASSVSANRTRWTDMLRRTTLARSVRASNSIEGYDASLADTAAIIDDDAPGSIAAETVAALTGYRNAMTYIVSLAADPHTVIDESLIRSLHFMMISYDMSKLPGRWRTGPVYVTREEDNEQVYEAPDAIIVPDLVGELVAQINSADGVDPIVMGAMAHLNLTMIHPFKDGNGRMSRALQTLVMARNGIVAPEFSSIEEWLGANTEAYYAKLAEVGQGRWNPTNDALPWVRFCMIGYYQQLDRLIQRNVAAGGVWMDVEALRRELRLPDRVDSALVDAAFAFRVRAHRYREAEELSEAAASRDLRRLCELGLLVPHGEKRGRFYTAGERLIEIRQKHRTRGVAKDPYEIVRSESYKAALGSARDQHRD